MIGRMLALAGLMLLGVVLGLTGAFVQAQRALVDTVWGLATVPWGVAIAWIALLAAVRAGAWATGTRWGASAVLTGWLAATALLAVDSPSGDVALSEGARQMAYLVGGVILGSAAATFRVPRAVGVPPPGDGG